MYMYLLLTSEVVKNRKKLELRASRLNTHSLYSQNIYREPFVGECQEVLWWFALFGIAIAMMENVQFRGSEISVDEKYPSGGRKSALMKTVLPRVGNQR